jgi:hypothetical protein
MSQTHRALNPLEEAILAHLPDEGMKLGAYAWLAPSVADIREALNRGLPPEHRVKSSEVDGAVRHLVHERLAVQKPLTSTRGHGYQRTAAGKRRAPINPGGNA